MIDDTSIDYGNLMHDALRHLIQKVLGDVAENGLPGDHHFFISFDTSHPDVGLADWLKERYPGDMTIVIQHTYESLTVTETGFSVTLEFGGAPEVISVPYDAIVTFVDPSVEFGLRFETREEDEVPGALADIDDIPEAPMTENAEAEESEAEIVSLDSFRKS